jgi:hypothetical protein
MMAKATGAVTIGSNTDLKTAARRVCYLSRKEGAAHRNPPYPIGGEWLFALFQAKLWSDSRSGGLVEISRGK